MELGFKSFTSESEIEEKKKLKQKLWEQTRNPDQPLDAPEEEYDPRTLYQRLKEQKDRKQEEFEEARKFKNLIKGLDNDEVTFLEMIDESKQNEENKRLKEEKKAIEEFQKHVADLTQSEQEKRIIEFKKSLFSKTTSSSKDNLSNRLTTNNSSSKRQAYLLANAIKRKSLNNEESNKKIKKVENTDNKDKKESNDKTNIDTCLKNNKTDIKPLGRLLGLGSYYSDESDSSSEELNKSKDEVILSVSNNSNLKKI